MNKTRLITLVITLATMLAVLIVAFTGCFDEPTPSVELSSVSVTQQPEKTVYYVGEGLVSGGKITAVYSNASTKTIDITAAMLSAVDMTTAGQKTVTVSYTENGITKTCTFTITVNEAIAKEESVTVTFETNGGKQIQPLVLEKGEKMDNQPVGEKIGFFFQGWYRDEECTQMIYCNEAINEDITLYAGFTESVDTLEFIEQTETVINDVDKMHSVDIVTDSVITMDTIGNFIIAEVVSGDYTSLNLIKTQNGYSLVPVDGYTAGGMYSIILVNNGVTFDGQPASVRKLTLQIGKESSSTIELKTGIKNVNYSYIDNVTDGKSEALNSGFFVISNQNYIEIAKNEGEIKAGDILCLTKGFTENEINADLEKIYVKVKEVESDIFEQYGYTIKFEDCTFEDIIENVDVYMQDSVDVAEMLSSDFNDRVVQSLYASQGTETLTTMLAYALLSSETIAKKNDGPLYNASVSGTTFSDNAWITSSVSATVKALLKGLEITAISGVARNTNFAADPDSWTALSVVFHYETTIKKVEIDITLTITEYLSMTVQGGQRSVGKTIFGIPIDTDIEFNYALNIYTQTDFELTVLVCTVDPDDNGQQEEEEDISIEIAAIMSGDEEASTDNIVKQLQEFLDTKEGTYLTLCEVPLITPIAIPVAGDTPIFQVNIDLEFVIKFQFAAGISTKLSILDAVQVGVIGNTKNKTYSTYRNTLPGSNRFSMDVYACGYLGIKAGIKTRLTVSFFSMRAFGEVGATFEAGVYVDIYGYLHCNLAKTNSYSNKLDFNIQGGLYAEFGLYLEVELIARSTLLQFEKGVGILDVKIPLFDLGDKYVLIDVDEVSEKCFINKNVMPISEMSIFTGTYIDITTGEEVTRPIDTSKIMLWFSTPYFRYEPYDGTIRLNPNAIGRYDDGVKRGDLILTTTMSVSYSGSILSFRSAFLGEVELTWVDESIKVDEANLGKFYTATFVADCDGTIIPLGERLIEVGHHVGSLDVLYMLQHYDINQDYGGKGGWDMIPGDTAMDDQDMVFTLHLHYKQTLVGYIYYGENGWTQEIRTANIGETPQAPEYAENEYIADLEFVGWKGRRGYNARMQDTFVGLIEIPFDVFGYSHGFQIPWSEDVGKTVSIIGGFPDSQSALTDLLKVYPDCFNYKSACYYVAEYNCSQYPVTVFTKDYNGEEISNTYNVDFGSKISMMYLDSNAKGYEIVGWDVDGDGVEDFVEPYDAPVVTGELTIRGVFKEITGQITIFDDNGEILSKHTAPTYTHLFVDVFDELHTLDETLSKRAAENESFYYGKGANGWMTGFEYSRDCENWYTIYDFKYPLWMMDVMYIRPNCYWVRNVTFSAGEGKFDLNANTFTIAFNCDTILPTDITNGCAYIEKTPTAEYEQIGWRDLNDGSFYKMDEVITLKGDMSLEAVFRQSERLYTLEIVCEKSKLPDSDVYTKNIYLLSYDELTEKMQYYRDNYPEPVTIDNQVYIYGAPLITENAAQNTVRIEYLPGVTSAFYTLTFQAGEGAFVGGEKVKQVDSLKVDRVFPLSRIAVADYWTADKVYTHCGWLTADGITLDKNADYTVTGNATLTALYEQSDRVYTITFVAGCGYFENGQFTYEVRGGYNEAVTAPDYPVDNSFYPSYDNKCVGWNKTVPTSFTEDITINAVWEHIPKNYSITYMLNGEPYGVEYAQYLEAIGEKDAPVVPEGKAFSGWQWATAAIKLDSKPSTMPCYNLYVYGEIITYYVIYSVDGVEEKIATNIGEDVSVRGLPLSPVGYTYQDWSIEGAIVEEGAFVMPNNDVIISTSKTVHEFDVNYVLDGVAFHQQRLAFGQELEDKKVPYKDGYTFTGWYCDGNALKDGYLMPDKEAEVIGVYEINEYSVCYYINGTPVPVYSDTFNYGETVNVRASESSPSFSGWVCAEFAFGTQSFTMPSHNVAVWGSVTEGDYSITYNLSGIGEFTQKANAGEQIVLPFTLSELHLDVEWTSADVTIQSNTFVMTARDITVNGTLGTSHSVYLYDGETGALLERFDATAFDTVMLKEYVKRGKVTSTFEQFEGKGVEIVDGSFVMPSTDIKLNAVWRSYLTIDDGVNVDKYDTDSPNVYGFSYTTEYDWVTGKEYKLITITESGLTLSGSANDVQIMIAIKQYDGFVTLSNLSVHSTSDSYLLYTDYDGDFLRNYSMDGTLVIDTEYDVTINIDGTVCIENAHSENAPSDRYAAISAISSFYQMMAPEEQGMLSDNKMIFVGISDDALLEIYSNCRGFFTYNNLEMNNLSLKIKSDNTALQSAGLVMRDVECDIAVKETEHLLYEAITSKSDILGNGLPLSFTDCALNIKGTVYGSGLIEFVGKTFGTIEACGRSAVIVNEGDLRFDVDKGCRLRFVSDNSIAQDSILSVFLILVDNEIQFADGNRYFTDVRLLLHAVKRDIIGFSQNGFNQLGYYENDVYKSALDVTVGCD